MSKWEYEERRVAIPGGPGVLQMLNEMGDQEWELVACPVEGSVQVFYFKRPKPPESTPLGNPRERAIRIRSDETDSEVSQHPTVGRWRRHIDLDDE